MFISTSLGNYFYFCKKHVIMKKCIDNSQNIKMVREKGAERVYGPEVVYHSRETMSSVTEQESCLHDFIVLVAWCTWEPRCTSKLKPGHSTWRGGLGVRGEGSLVAKGLLTVLTLQERKHHFLKGISTNK